MSSLHKGPEVGAILLLILNYLILTSNLIFVGGISRISLEIVAEISFIESQFVILWHTTSLAMSYKILSFVDFQRCFKSHLLWKG